MYNKAHFQDQPQNTNIIKNPKGRWNAVFDLTIKGNPIYNIDNEMQCSLILLTLSLLQCQKAKREVDRLA